MYSKTILMCGPLRGIFMGEASTLVAGSIATAMPVALGLLAVGVLAAGCMENDKEAPQLYQGKQP